MAVDPQNPKEITLRIPKRPWDTTNTETSYVTIYDTTAQYLGITIDTTTTVIDVPYFKGTQSARNRYSSILDDTAVATARPAVNYAVTARKKGRLGDPYTIITDKVSPDGSKRRVSFRVQAGTPQAAVIHWCATAMTGTNKPTNIISPTGQTLAVRQYGSDDVEAPQAPADDTVA